MKRFYEAVGAHYENWEEIRQMTIAKALGSHAVLNEPRLFRPSYMNKRKKRKKILGNRDQKYLVEGSTDFEEEDFEEDDYDDDDI